MSALYPAKRYRFVLRDGMRGHEVAALQLLLNELRGARLSVDGSFGPFTRTAVTSFQRDGSLTVDGIAGPATQGALARMAVRAADGEQELPPGLLRGLMESESGGIVGCVNWSVPPGVDAGLIQDRVNDPAAATNERWRVAFGVSSLHVTAGGLRSRKDRFRRMPGAQSDRRAWELAVLAHNFPWAAEQLALGKTLSDKPIAWVTALGISGVESNADWARFYIEKVTALVRAWTK